MLHSVLAMHDALSDVDHDIIVVLPADQHDTWRDIVAQHRVTVPHSVATGGATRYHSVYNGLDAAGAMQVGDVVLVHDAVRPLATPALIRTVRNAVIDSRHAAVPVVPLTDSVRRVTGAATVAVDRKTLVAVQTPQGCDAMQLRHAYFDLVPYNDTLTDDASVIEAAGGTVVTVPGDPSNIKITHHIDLATAEAIIKSRQNG